MSLEVDNLSAGYGAKPVVRNVSFRVAPGRILSLLGHNGAGKTTTLKSVLGLNAQARGEVRLAGARIEHLPVGARVGLGLRLLPEGRGIFPDLTVGENLDVVAERNCREADCKIGIADALNLFTALRPRLDAAAGSMSGGQQQMLAFALAILGSPKCLLLDEPSIGLAPNLVERLFALVQDVCREHGMSAVLVEQNVAASMKVADTVTILNNGEVVFDGSPEESRSSSFWHYF